MTSSGPSETTSGASAVARTARGGEAARVVGFAERPSSWNAEARLRSRAARCGWARAADSAAPARRLRRRSTDGGVRALRARVADALLLGERRVEPAVASSSSCVPRSTMRPSSSTTMRSQRARGRDAVGDEDARCAARPAARWPRGSRPRSSRRPRDSGSSRMKSAAPTRARGRARCVALPARELHAALADDRVEPLGELQRLLEHLGLARGRRGCFPSRRASPGRRARSRCCATPSSRRETRPAARSRCAERTDASGSSHTSTPSMQHGVAAASAEGARGASRAWSCPSRCAPRSPATRPRAP